MGYYSFLSHNIPVNKMAKIVVYTPSQPDDKEETQEDEKLLLNTSIESIQKQLKQHNDRYKINRQYIENGSFNNKEKTALLQTLADVSEREKKHLKDSIKELESEYWERKKRKGHTGLRKTAKYQNLLIDELSKLLTEEQIMQASAKAIKGIKTNAQTAE